MNFKRLSKALSYALRHNPKSLGINLDEEGWTNLEDIFAGLARRNSQWKNINISHLEEMMAQSDKQRFQIKDGKIRAVYGHSIKQKITKETTQPPEILYHGTARKTVPLIETSGLKSMGRQYVHLSADTETAVIVGKRRDSQPTILQVRALDAFNSGISFYAEENNIWLSEEIPPEFIVFGD